MKKSQNFDKERKEKIVEFVKNNPYCSQDKIFTKGNIPKSKKTIELLQQLISKKKISVSRSKRIKKYFVGELDFLKELEIITKDYEYEIKKDPSKDNKLSRKVIEFLKNRVKILKREQKYDSKLDISNTLEMFNWVSEYHKKPSKLFEFVLLDWLSFAITDDKYYLAHQLHSTPRNTKQKFQKTKTKHVRRSVENLYEMKKKGRHDFGLLKKDYQKNMKKFGNPSEWLDRFYAEKGRTLYKNPEELEQKIRKKQLKSIKLKENEPNYAQRKKIIEAELKSFPDIPIAKIIESMNEEDKEEMRKLGKELGVNFDSVIEFARKIKFIPGNK